VVRQSTYDLFPILMFNCKRSSILNRFRGKVVYWSRSNGEFCS